EVHPPDLWMGHRAEGVAVPAKRQQPPQHYLHVPPRHRLDCHVFKGFGLIEVAVDAPHLVASEIHDDRVWRFDRHTAALPASPNPANYEHPVTEIAELLGEYAELTPCLGDDLAVRLDTSSSVEASALHGTAQGREQLDVLGRVGRKRL